MSPDIFDRLYNWLDLEELGFEPLEPAVVGPGLLDQGDAEVELVQVVEHLVHPGDPLAADM